MLAIGPGRNKAIIAIMSVIVVGFNSFKYLVMPEPPSWKQPDGFPFGQMLKSIFVVHRDFFNIYFYTPSFFNQIHGISQGGQVLNSQKVHFEQAGFFHRIHIVLGDDFIAVRFKLEEHSRSGRLGNDDSGGVHRDMPGSALYFLGDVYYFFNLAFFLYISASSGAMLNAWSMVIGNPCEPSGMSLEILSPSS